MEVGLSEGYVEQLRQLRAASPSAALRAICSAHGVIAVLLFRLKLRNLLVPYRSACYALLRWHGRGDEKLWNGLTTVAAECATAALLLPTAALGACIRLLLRVGGKEKWVQFGPPPQKPAKAKEEAPSDKAPASA